MSTRTVVLRTLGLIGLAVTLASPALAQAPASSPWQVSWTPVGVWGMGIEGPVTVKGFTRDVDVTFNDLFDHVKASFGTSLEARKGRGGTFFNLSYIKLGPSSDATAIAPRADLFLKWVVVEFGGSYAVVAKPSVVLSLLGGVRYTGLKAGIEAVDQSFNVETDPTDWVDPFVGAQLVRPLGTKVALSLKGDIGGFDLSDRTSVLTWTVFPALSLRLHRKLILSGGYRYTSIEFDGEGPQVFQLDQDMSGPALGMTLVF